MSNIVGTEFEDYLLGTPDDDWIQGLGGSDTLDGSGGNDWLSGGAGNDTYYFGFGSGFDTISEGDPLSPAGFDVVRLASGVASSDIQLRADTSSLYLQLVGTGDELKLEGFLQPGITDPIDAIYFEDGSEIRLLRGTSADDFLMGSQGIDVFLGGAGADTLNGAAGNDLYVHGRDSGIDTITDTADASGGNRLVFADWTTSGELTLSHEQGYLVISLPSFGDKVRLSGFDNRNVFGARAVESYGFSDGTLLTYEALLARGFDIYGTGIVSQDVLEGTNIQDRIYGSSLGELLSGLNGNDTLYGGGGDDTLHGDEGNGDVGDDHLDGGAGNDSLLGWKGNDAYYFDRLSGQDTILELQENLGDIDTLVFGDNIMRQDLLVTRGNFDNLLVEISGSTASLRFNAWFNPDIPSHVERFVFRDGTVLTDQDIEAMINDAPTVANPLVDQSATEETAFTYTVPGDAFFDPDVAIGDTLTYTASLADGSALPSWLSFDAATRTFGGTPMGADLGTMSVKVTATDSAGAQASDIFDLTVNPWPDLNLTGTSGADTLTGKSGNDTLNGLAGADTMIGARGNDTYYVDNAGDVVTEQAGQGDDTVLSSITYTLAANVENLTLTGTAKISATGSVLNNRLIGNSNTNTLTGGAGDDYLDGGANRDTMIGGTGNDIFVIDHTGDRITENANEGSDTVFSSLTYTLGSNLENLTLLGTSAINGTGNSVANLLVGNSATNALAGAGGNDILQGLDGNDTLSDSSGTTLFDGGAGVDSTTGNAANELFIGGTGNDIIGTGSGTDIIAFNAGDGQDAVAASTATDNTVSLGGGIRYVDLAFAKAGDDLILKTGSTDQLTFTNWYGGNRSVSTLQVMAEAMAEFDAGSSDPLLNQKVQWFDFSALVSEFDQARALDPNLSQWNLMNALLDAHLAASDTDAIGGDLAYQYGVNGTLSGIGLTAAQDVLNAPQFGTSAQTLRPLSTLQEGLIKLS